MTCGRGILVRVRGTGATDAGAIALIVALLAPVLLAFCALAVDVARWYVESERIQKAADAAANAGVVYLPQDFAQAKITALDVAARNGYVPSSTVTITVEPADRPSQLRVTVTSTVANAFAATFGMPRTTVSRTAVSDYSGPVAMGSPCNLFGNEPLGPTQSTAGSSTNCTFGSTPNFWANIAGPQTSKENGDRYATQGCSSSSNSYCGGSGQTDNCDHFGSSNCQGVSVTGKTVYYFRVRIAPGAGSVDVQVYDPAFVNVGDHCTVNLPFTSSTNPSWNRGDMPNPFVTDATVRYQYGDPTTADSRQGTPASPGTYCTGDNAFGFTSSLPTTTYALLAPNDSGDPARSTPVATCTPQQYRGLNVDLGRYLDASTAEGKSTDGSYAQKTFRRWVSINCPVLAPASGLADYFLEVRSNLKTGSVSNAAMADLSDQSGVTGSGHNRFSIRAVATGSRDDVSIAAYERMPIYANLKSGAATKFYLARVPSAGAGNLLRIQFFDTGDSTDTGTIRVTAPGDNSGKTAITCYDKGFQPSSSSTSTVLSGCTLTNVNASTGYQGKVKEVDIQVPSDYLCNDTSSAGCWFTVTYAYGTTSSGGSVADTTTWSASLDGDPVRLIK